MQIPTKNQPSLRTMHKPTCRSRYLEKMPAYSSKSSKVGYQLICSCERSTSGPNIVSSFFLLMTHTGYLCLQAPLPGWNLDVYELQEGNSSLGRGRLTHTPFFDGPASWLVGESEDLDLPRAPIRDDASGQLLPLTRPLKVCLMTADFWGRKGAGGTATAYSLLAAALDDDPDLEVHFQPSSPVLFVLLIASSVKAGKTCELLLVEVRKGLADTWRLLLRC